MKPIVISNFQRGIASSPNLGFSKIVGLDIDITNEGSIYPGIRLTQTSDAPDGLVVAKVIDKSGSRFIATDAGTVYKNSSIIQSGLGIVHDLQIYKDYLFVTCAGTSLHIYGPISNSPQWFGNWKTGLDTSLYGYKKLVVGKDNIVYFGNETKVASISSFSGGTPYVSPTGTLNTSALDLPTGKYIQTMCEYGRYLAIMSSLGDGSFGNSSLYFWDRVAASVELPVEIRENKVRQMISSHNYLIFVSQNTGKIYRSDFTNYVKVAEIPNRLSTQTYTTYPNAIEELSDEILIGIGGSMNSAFDTVYGVYSLGSNNRLTCKHIISTGGYGQTNNISIGVIRNYTTDTTYVSWKDGSTNGIDLSDFRIGTGYNVYFESELFEIATDLDEGAYQTIEYNFTEKLKTGYGFKVKYRTNLDEDWTTLNTYTYTTKGAVNHWNDSFPIVGANFIQLRGEFDTGTATYGDNLGLKSIVIK